MTSQRHPDNTEVRALSLGRARVRRLQILTKRTGALHQSFIPFLRHCVSSVIYPLERVKQCSLLKRSSYIPDIPAKNHLKKPTSDQQEEGSSAKRPKKLDHVKLLGRKKNAAIKKSDVASKSSPSPSNSNMGSKQQQKTLVEESSIIMNLKFPPSSTSIANLKTRLVRFGSLIVDQFKVSWKMPSCKVMFTDALEACSHIRKNNLFGQVKIACTCSAEEFGLQCSQTEMMRQHLEAWRTPRSQQPVVPPKYILKQPSDSVTRKRKRSASGKEKLRVKFRLPIDDSVL